MAEARTEPAAAQLLEYPPAVLHLVLGTQQPALIEPREAVDQMEDESRQTGPATGRAR